MLTFMLNAMTGVILISIASAMIGTYIVTRRMVFISGGITHACFGGLGLGYYLGWSPMAMAAVFAVGGALGVDRLSRAGARRDSAIAVIWALGMALGILFIFMTDGYVPELNTFLFGNVLTITQTDLWIFGIYDVALLLFYLIFFPLIVTVSFDPDFARTRHLPAETITFIMTVFTGVAIVLTIRMIGIMLLMSLVSLPQLISERFTRRYLPLMLLSTCMSLSGCIGGLWLAWMLNVPASAAIVILLVCIYGIASLLPRRRVPLPPPLHTR
ncbi:MAG: metal ABC transporter permease [Muribaculaceae bacterium]|nr:metal ABC transporter permease [Muribaculaceae bacterium]